MSFKTDGGKSQLESAHIDNVSSAMLKAKGLDEALMYQPMRYLKYIWYIWDNPSGRSSSASDSGFGKITLQINLLPHDGGWIRKIRQKYLADMKLFCII